MTRKVLLAPLIGLSVAAGVAFAQYPDRPVRMIVTFPPGGGADLLARVIGKQLSDKWAQESLE